MGASVSPCHSLNGFSSCATSQGLTLVHLSAQRKHIFWERWEHNFPPAFYWTGVHREV